jgi:tol-pal system protein YbgF
MHKTAFCRAALLGFLFLNNPSHAAIFGDDEARKAILQLRQRVDTVTADQNAEISDIKNRLNKLEEQVDGSGRGQLEVTRQLEQLRNEVAQLRGQVETLTNELANTQKRQRDLYSDLDKRLTAFEPKTVAVDGVEGKVDQAEQKAYDAAVAVYQARDFKGAVSAMNRFLTNYPKSVYAPQLLHWMGNAYYALRDCKSASAAQERVIQDYPTSTRVPDALLNLATCQNDLNDRKAARKSLETVVRQYPNTDAAVTAQDRLSKLK